MLVVNLIFFIDEGSVGIHLNPESTADNYKKEIAATDLFEMCVTYG